MVSKRNRKMVLIACHADRPTLREEWLAFYGIYRLVRKASGKNCHFYNSIQDSYVFAFNSNRKYHKFHVLCTRMYKAKSDPLSMPLHARFLLWKTAGYLSITNSTDRVRVTQVWKENWARYRKGGLHVKGN